MSTEKINGTKINPAIAAAPASKTSPKAAQEIKTYSSITETPTDLVDIKENSQDLIERRQDAIKRILSGDAIEEELNSQEKRSLTAGRDYVTNEAYDAIQPKGFSAYCRDLDEAALFDDEIAEQLENLDAKQKKDLENAKTEEARSKIIEATKKAKQKLLDKVQLDQKFELGKTYELILVDGRRVTATYQQFKNTYGQESKGFVIGSKNSKLAKDKQLITGSDIFSFKEQKQPGLNQDQTNLEIGFDSFAAPEAAVPLEKASKKSTSSSEKIAKGKVSREVSKLQTLSSSTKLDPNNIYLFINPNNSVALGSPNANEPSKTYALDLNSGNIDPFYYFTVNSLRDWVPRAFEEMNKFESIKDRISSQIYNISYQVNNRLKNEFGYISYHNDQLHIYKQQQDSEPLASFATKDLISMLSIGRDEPSSYAPRFLFGSSNLIDESKKLYEFKVIRSTDFYYDQPAVLSLKAIQKMPHRTDAGVEGMIYEIYESASKELIRKHLFVRTLDDGSPSFTDAFLIDDLGKFMEPKGPKRSLFKSPFDTP